MEVKESNLSFRNFLKVYENELVPKFKTLEQTRIGLKRKDIVTRIIFSVLIIVGISCFLLPMILIYTASTLNDSLSAFLPIIGILIIVALCTRYDLQKNNKDFKNLIKNKTINDVLQIFCNIKWIKHDKNTALVHSCDSIFSKMNKSGLFTDFDEVYIDDEFDCKYKEVPFNIYETKLIKYGPKNSRQKVFQGIVVFFKYNKKIRNRTVISTKGNHTRKQNFLTAIGLAAIATLEIFKHGYSHLKLAFAIIFILISAFIAYFCQKYEEPLNKIILEDPKFIKKFNVYSSDDTEARYLVTPLFMELLNKFTTAYNSKKIKCSFFDDNFMVAISTNNDCFEIGDLYTSLNSSKYIFRFYRELKSIYNMIEYFKLDKKY